MAIFERRQQVLLLSELRGESASQLLGHSCYGLPSYMRSEPLKEVPASAVLGLTHRHDAVPTVQKFAQRYR